MSAEKTSGIGAPCQGQNVKSGENAENARFSGSEKGADSRVFCWVWRLDRGPGKEPAYGVFRDSRRAEMAYEAFGGEIEPVFGEGGLLPGVGGSLGVFK